MTAARRRSSSTTSPTPRFSPEIEQLRAGLADMAPACPLEPDALCRRRRRADRRSTTSATLRSVPASTSCAAALRDEADLSPSGIVSWYSQLLQFLKNRLLVQDLLTRHPEIHDVAHRAAHHHLRSAPHRHHPSAQPHRAPTPACGRCPYWESLEPVLADAERPGPGEPDPRRARTAVRARRAQRRPCPTSTGCTR